MEKESQSPHSYELFEMESDETIDDMFLELTNPMKISWENMF